jgi:hypothetical protein
MSSKILSAREALQIEYGGARNFMTPQVVRVGKLDRDTAYELASGSGFEPGSAVYGVSVVRILSHEARQTERDYDRSSVFSSLEDAEAYVESLRLPAALESRRVDLEAAARAVERRGQAERMEALGRECGTAAGSWLLDGNSSEAEARALLEGIEAGDPATMDALPSAPLSGEWADGLTAAGVLEEAGIEPDSAEHESELVDAFEAGYTQGVADEACRLARAILGEEQCHA